MFPPQNISNLYPKKSTGVSACPAVQHYENRVFYLRSPYTFRIHAEYEDNQWFFYPVYPFTEITESLLFQLLQFQPRSAWRDPFVPILQLLLSYVFFSDEEDVFINQIEAPCLKDKNWSVMSGRFNIYDWQRPINWSIAWTNPHQDLVVRRGDPLCAFLFESRDPQRAISLEEVAYNEELKMCVDSVKDVSSQSRGTFRLLPIQRSKRKSHL